MMQLDSALDELGFGGPSTFARASAQARLTRALILRALGAIYVVAFTIVVNQWAPLLGARGLMPIGAYLARVQLQLGSTSAAVWQVPSLFWLNHSDGFALGLGWLGLLLAACVVLGFANTPIMALLWVVYSSFVHTGQSFYGFGWEMLLLEAGFLAIFLAPLWNPVGERQRAPALSVIWLYRWLAFRLLFGAGLIKIRGDECWRDLTCLYYHYETQPNPHPLSWLWHQAPLWVHKLGTLFNHFCELVVPFGLFGPRRLRLLAGALSILFQGTIIASGNLSFLNWLTIAILCSCFDDSVLLRCLPIALRERVARPALSTTPLRQRVCVGLCIVVALLSLDPVANMLSPRQRMNASFEPFGLVNTYGAFGSVGRTRDEVVIEGTNADPADDQAEWKEYEFPCKPTDPLRRPCLITPYHYRLDWQLWFAGFGSPQREPWIVHLVYELLIGEPNIRQLLARDPFPEAPPTYIRISRYRYTFTHWGQAGWYERARLETYLRPLSRDDPQLLDFLAQHGWGPHGLH